MERRTFIASSHGEQLWVGPSTESCLTGVACLGGKQRCSSLLCNLVPLACLHTRDRSSNVQELMQGRGTNTGPLWSGVTGAVGGVQPLIASMVANVG